MGTAIAGAKACRGGANVTRAALLGLGWLLVGNSLAMARTANEAESGAGVGNAGEEPLTTRRFSGVARDSKGAVVYRERHKETYRGEKLESVLTRYFDARGKLIGRLTSDYRRSAFAPSYHFKDLRTGKGRGAEYSGPRFVLYDGAKRKTLRSRGSLPLVLGQGLHHYARANLNSLAQGYIHPVRFGIPSRQSTYDFRFKRSGRSRDGVVRLRIEVDNWLLRLVAPSIEVEYETGTRRLLSYRGVSNLQGAAGETMQVAISYRYERIGQL